MHVCVHTKCRTGIRNETAYWSHDNHALRHSMFAQKKKRNPSKEARLSFRAGARESLGTRLLSALRSILVGFGALTTVVIAPAPPVKSGTVTVVIGTGGCGCHCLSTAVLPAIR